MRIGIIDADLLDKGTRHPNLALMKISSYCKQKGHDTSLVLDYSETPNFDKLYMSKVFYETKVPTDIVDDKRLHKGGTGFYGAYAPKLPYGIEHSKPDYTLYKEYVNSRISSACKKGDVDVYVNYSIGFTTRGCFRKCDFCVNRSYDRAEAHSPVTEFLDEEKKGILLLDDNFLACKSWSSVLDTLQDTKKPFQFKQGLDIRLMTDERAMRFSQVKYKGDFIFAFDYLRDKELIDKKLSLWRKHCSKSTKLYTICAYESQDGNDIASLFERIQVLMKHGCLAYITRYNAYRDSKLEKLYVNLARWGNQASFFKKTSFREFCEMNQELHKNPKTLCSAMQSLVDFEKEYPEIAKKYFDMKFENENRFNNKWSDL